MKEETTAHSRKIENEHTSASKNQNYQNLLLIPINVLTISISVLALIVSLVSYYFSNTLIKDGLQARIIAAGYKREAKLKQDLQRDTIVVKIAYINTSNTPSMILSPMYDPLFAYEMRQQNYVSKHRMPFELYSKQFPIILQPKEMKIIEVETAVEPIARTPIFRDTLIDDKTYKKTYIKITHNAINSKAETFQVGSKQGLILLLGERNRIENIVNQLWEQGPNTVVY